MKSILIYICCRGNPGDFDIRKKLFLFFKRLLPVLQILALIIQIVRSFLK
jgi:hypothetical protein